MVPTGGEPSSPDHGGEGRSRRPRHRPRRVPPTSVGNGLHLFALTGFAFARPIFDLLGNNASLFIAWRTTAIDLAALVVAALFVPLLALWAFEALATAVLPRRPGAWVHPTLCGALVGLFVVEELKRLGPRGAPLVAVAVLAGGGATLLVARVAVARQWLRYAAVGPVLFTVMLLVATPVPSIVFAGDTKAAEVEVGDPTRVVVVVLDEFPLISLLDGEGAIDESLYPNFAALAGESTWYRNSTTIAPLTEQAVPAILTGRNPVSESTIPYLSEYPDNLFTLLGGTYAVHGRESVTGLCPTSICGRAPAATGASAGARGMFGDVAELFGDIVSPNHEIEFSFTGLHSADPAAIATANQFLRGVRPTARRPRLDVLHLLLPHFPWHYLQSQQDYSPSPPHPIGLDGQDWINQWTAAQARHRHLLQVQATDTLLGQLVAQLRALGEWDDTLFVVTADHGAAFRAGEPFRGVAQATIPDIVWTPMFVKYPGQSGGLVDDRPARSTDILPTIADVIDVEIPWAVDGVSLRGQPRRDGDRPVLAWERNALRPAEGDYLAVEGPEHFATVLAADVTPYPDDDPFRLYRLDEWGPLIGRRVADIDRQASSLEGTEPDAVTVTIDGRARFENIVAIAPRIPWADFHATVEGAPAKTMFAVSVNGTVAGVFPAVGPPLDGMHIWGTLPISMFEVGPNRVEVYQVDGAPSSPSLRAVTVAG